MYDYAIIWEWLEFTVRWLHVITAIAWIGSSFYFIALDLGLNRANARKADGEAWQVHGGGFYHIQKYLVAPDHLPQNLTWFKWESYVTWLSGAALLAIVYWAGGQLYLIDPTKADLTLWQGILISAGFIVFGWLGYDLLCKSALRNYPNAVMFVLCLGIIAASWALNQIFTGRAALLHLGAMTATLMSANVFFIIIPNQRIVVTDLKAGRAPNPKYGKIAKLRSTHNNYLTLPVLFLMLSNHYPLAFGTQYAWIIACLVFLMGVTIRHFFNTLHSHKKPPYWTWGVSAITMILIAWLSAAGQPQSPDQDYSNGGGGTPTTTHTPTPTTYESAIINTDGFDDVYEVVVSNCSMCHGQTPVWDGVYWAPAGVILDSPQAIARQAKNIYLHAGISQSMPPANAFHMSQENRAIIKNWYSQITP